MYQLTDETLNTFHVLASCHLVSTQSLTAGSKVGVNNMQPNSQSLICLPMATAPLQLTAIEIQGVDSWNWGLGMLESLLSCVQSSSLVYALLSCTALFLSCCVLVLYEHRKLARVLSIFPPTECGAQHGENNVLWSWIAPSAITVQSTSTLSNHLSRAGLL